MKLNHTSTSAFSAQYAKKMDAQTMQWCAW